MDFRRVENAASIFAEGSRKLTHALRSLKGTIPKREFYSGLLHLREDGLKYALSESPGDILEAFLANQFFKQGSYPKDIEPQMIERMEHFKHLLFSQHHFHGIEQKIRSGDVLVFATRNGEENLFKIRNCPTRIVRKAVSDLRKAVKNLEPPPAEDPMFCYSEQMMPVLKWCKENCLPPSLDSLKVSVNFRKGSLTLSTIESTIGPLPLHLISWDDILKMILKYLYRFPEIRTTVEKYTHHMYKSRFVFSLESPPKRMQAYMMSRTNKWFLESALPDESVPWPLNFGNKSLWASSALIGLVIREARDVQTRRQKSGWDFEEKVRVQLVDRDFAILAKDKESPSGEIDLLVKKGDSVWVLEAKDYTLWYENWYASSRLFRKRNSSLEASFAKIPNKIKWVDLNRLSFDIKDHQILGAVVSAFSEDVKLPAGVRKTTLKEMSSLFGKSKYKSYHETVYDHAIRNEKNLAQQFRLVRGLKPKICPAHPACIFMAVEDSQIDMRLLGDFCSIANAVWRRPMSDSERVLYVDDFL